MPKFAAPVGIRVVNRRIEAETVYIGRGSPLGNPYRINVDGDRDSVIAKYRDYLVQQIADGNKQIKDALNHIYTMSKHSEVRLGCFCKPKSCHGDVIKEIIESKARELAKDTRLIIAFTGHRPNKLGGYDLNSEKNQAIYKAIKDELIMVNPKGCISGMALGIDTLGAMACNELGIPWIAAVPFIGQESKWPMSSQNHYHQLLATAHKVHIVSDGGYSPKKMQLRNQWMVDNCDVLIAVWNGDRSGGTYNCIQYAESQGTRVIRIEP